MEVSVWVLQEMALRKQQCLCTQPILTLIRPLPLSPHKEYPISRGAPCWMLQNKSEIQKPVLRDFITIFSKQALPISLTRERYHPCVFQDKTGCQENKATASTPRQHLLKTKTHCSEALHWSSPPASLPGDNLLCVNHLGDVRC